MDDITELLRLACQNAFGISLAPHSTDSNQGLDQDLHGLQIELTRPDEQFGDYATNLALQLATSLKQNPREVGAKLAAAVQALNSPILEKIEVAGPGFLNITLSSTALTDRVQRATEVATPFSGQTIVVEYSDPNPFKVLHAGHLYTSMVGDAIANLLQVAGAEVHRVNFGGDVGMHVGKTLWAILKRLGGEYPEKLADVDPAKRAEWMASAYVEGNNAYDDNQQAKAEMQALNKKVYRIHAENDHDSPLAHIYWTARTWSYDYFDTFYARIGTQFEKYYPESGVAERGLQTVQSHVGDVFEESAGAVVFKGEDHGLHTRVFINSEGIPTYEAKDVGLIMQKWDDYHFDRSLVITGNEQQQYMEVVLKAIAQFAPELADATTHLTHGIVKLQGGIKMSSRRGNILRAVDVLDAAAEANKAATGKDDDQVVLGAVKYAFLKQRLGGDIIYDPKESISLEGNSGPYLQYALVRARSILRKATTEPELPDGIIFEPGERSLARKLSEYQEVVFKATNELLPHHICTYLYELAQVFNRFYENNRVIGDEREVIRLGLVTAYAGVLESGLELLGVPTPDKM